MLSPNRTVGLVTPLAAPLAGAFAAWLTQTVPGLGIPEDTIEQTFLGVTALVFALALQFNHNRFKWDVHTASAGGATELAPVEEEPATADDLGFDEGDETFDLMAALDPDDDGLLYNDDGGVLLEGEDETGGSNGNVDLPSVR